VPDAEPTVSDTAPLLRASLRQAMSRFGDHAFRLRGRASRSEYWWWMLVNVVVLALIQVLLPVLITGQVARSTLLVGPLGALLGSHLTLFAVAEPTGSADTSLFLLIAAAWAFTTLAPGLTVAVRRLHDSNLSGRWALLALLPVGSLVVLLLAIRRSRPEGARFDG
jgi:uncharacterized membrane protein YhaH (DUF805 family)